MVKIGALVSLGLAVLAMVSAFQDEDVDFLMAAGYSAFAALPMTVFFVPKRARSYPAVARVAGVLEVLAVLGLLVLSGMICG